MLGKAKRIGLGSSRAHTATMKAPSRDGQAQFRRDVIAAYQGRCCVTGCTQPQILEAAHIVPYSMARNHSVGNGLCVRSDIHSLFDCGLIGIGPDYRVQVSPRVTDPVYALLQGQPIEIPQLGPLRPEGRYLEWHLSKIFDAGEIAADS